MVNDEIGFDEAERSLIKLFGNSGRGHGSALMNLTNAFVLSTSLEVNPRDIS